MRNDKKKQPVKKQPVKKQLKQTASKRSTNATVKSKNLTKSTKAKKVRPNQFKGADDIYLTKNKIAVTKIRTEQCNNVNKLIVTTKYYEQNDRNMRNLREVEPVVRRGRNGSKYEKI